MDDAKKEIVKEWDETVEELDGKIVALCSKISVMADFFKEMKDRFDKIKLANADRSISIATQAFMIGSMESEFRTESFATFIQDLKGEKL